MVYVTPVGDKLTLSPLASKHKGVRADRESRLSLQTNEPSVLGATLISAGSRPNCTLHQLPVVMLEFGHWVNSVSEYTKTHISCMNVPHATILLYAAACR